MRKLPSRLQLYVTVGILFLLAAVGITYKVRVLKFNLKPNDRTVIWQVEGRISFQAHGDPVKVSLAAPEFHPGFRVFSADEVSERNYEFRYDGDGDLRRAEWSAEKADGGQTIFYRLKIFDARLDADRTPGAPPEPPERPVWEGRAARLAAQKLLEQAAGDGANTNQLALNLLRSVFRPDPAVGTALLLPQQPTERDRIELAINLLAERGIPARPVYGVQLIDGRRRQLVETMEVYFDSAWHGYHPAELAPGFPDQYLALRRGGKSLLDVEGGTGSSVRYSVFQAMVPSLTLLPARTDAIGSTLGALSIYNLPLENQNIFKRIALIPLGILLVVIIRNLVGIQTMGTFMPVLIALAFMDTELLPGIVSFLFITGIGFLIRNYFSHLNLLLVPRIAAVVLVVILLMKLFSLLSYRIGFTHGLMVTMFPLIIMAWTIERASILWEEDGPANTLKQFCASLGTGVVCCLLMSSRQVQHITFLFSEVDLIILGVILLLGSYTGYRLTELRRFKSLIHKS